MSTHWGDELVDCAEHLIKYPLAQLELQKVSYLASLQNMAAKDLEVEAKKHTSPYMNLTLFPQQRQLVLTQLCNAALSPQQEQFTITKNLTSADTIVSTIIQRLSLRVLPKDIKPLVDASSSTSAGQAGCAGPTMVNVAQMWELGLSEEKETCPMVVRKTVAPSHPCLKMPQVRSAL